MAITPLDYVPASAAGIEVFLFGADTNVDAPVILVTHGRGGSAQNSFHFCRKLAASGFIAVAFDQRNHGRRIIDPTANGGWNNRHAADMFAHQVGTAIDAGLLIDMLPAQLGIATERVGMTGVSMGGHATLVAMTVEPRIAVGASVIGSGDYRFLMELRAKDNACPPEDFPQYFPETLQRAVDKFGPIHHPERFADRPLLMTNGDTDTLVPMTCNQRFEAACRPFYTQQDRLKLSIYPGIGHAVPAEMEDEVLCWFRRWFVDEPR